MTYHIIVFDSTHHALKAEKLLKEGGVIHDIIPTPKDISSDCGISVRIYSQNYDFSKISALLSSESIMFTIISKENQ